MVVGILKMFVGEAARNLNYMYNNNLKIMQILLLLKIEMFKMNFIFEKKKSRKRKYSKGCQGNIHTAPW